MSWLKTIGIFLKGLFAYMNNPSRWEFKDKKWEVKKPVKEARAKKRKQRIEKKTKKKK